MCVLLPVGDVFAARQSTTVLHVAPQSITNDILTRVPASNAVAVKSKGFAAVQVIINLTTANKEAAGKTLELNVYADDGTFIAAINWASYGQQISVSLPDGTILVDPDPAVSININQLAGRDVYLTYFVHGISTAGITVVGLT
jgi:hypothetical protein